MCPSTLALTMLASMLASGAASGAAKPLKRAAEHCTPCKNMAAKPLPQNGPFGPLACALEG